MHLLVVDSSKPKLLRELRDVLKDAGLQVTIPPARDRRPMLRLPSGKWIHGKKKILKFAEGLHSQTGAK